MSDCESACDNWTGSHLVSYEEGSRKEARKFIEEVDLLELEEMLPYQTIVVNGPPETVESLEEIEPFTSVEREAKAKALSTGNLRPYTKETVIGHRVSARIDEKEVLPEDLRQRIHEMSGAKSPMIEITVGDVDWDETKSVRVRLGVLREIVEHFEDAEA